jgi:hypothetical protein
MIQEETPTLELTLRLTDREANLLRHALSKASREEDTVKLRLTGQCDLSHSSKQAGKLFWKSLRERESRFTIKELQYDRANRA